MELKVLDTNFIPVTILEGYESAIWTDRYNIAGDFELQLSLLNTSLKYMIADYYLANADSEHHMIIEDISIKTDPEEGVTIIVTGRSLESILDRRIIWTQTTLTGNLQTGIQTLINNSIVNPVLVERKIDNFIFLASEDPAITALTLEAQYTGDNLYAVISKICDEKNIGFKVTLNGNNQFVFQLYAGKDRSYSQVTNPYVIFSPKFDNISNTSYFYSKASKKTDTLVGGEGEGNDRKYAITGEGKTGLARREVFTEAGDVSTKKPGGGTLTEVEYTNQLKQKGNENLADNTETTIFDGELESDIQYKVGVDFFMGDVVQLEDDFGNSGKTRIVELIMSENNEGNAMYPTCKTITKEGE